MRIDYSDEDRGAGARSGSGGTNGAVDDGGPAGVARAEVIPAMVVRAVRYEAEAPEASRFVHNCLELAGQGLTCKFIAYGSVPGLRA